MLKSWSMQQDCYWFPETMTELQQRRRTCTPNFESTCRFCKTMLELKTDAVVHIC